MAKQTIGIGSAANDGTGSTLRAAFDICNDNFTELYDGSGGLLHKIEGTNFTGSLLIGHSTTGTLSSAENNTGVGISALDALTSGDHNTAIGQQAGSAITTGIQNTLIGSLAGRTLNIGNYNVAVGTQALATEDGHGHNVAIGRKALYTLNAGADAYNVAIGSSAGVNMTTGVQNTIIGGLAGDAITDANNNIAIGYLALTTETSGGNNVAIGVTALQQSNGGTYNVAIGRDSGQQVTTGDQNTFVGAQSGDAVTTGSNNTIIGYDAAASAVDVSNEVTIGNSSIANVRIPSDSTLKIGASGDLQLEHLSSNSFIKNTAVGDLYIENQVDDGDVIFRCDDGSGGLETYFFLDGSASSGNPFTVFPDLSELAFGTSRDLKIKHDGTDSSINNNTGDLYIKNSADDKDIIFQSDDGSGGTATYFRVDGGEVETRFLKSTLHFDNVVAKYGDGGDLQIVHNGTDTQINNTTGNLEFTQLANDKDISFASDNGSGGDTIYFFLDGSRADGTYVYTEFPDSSVIGLGNDTDLQLYHNGSNSMIDNFVADLVIQQRADDSDIIFKCDDGSGGVTEYFRLDGSAAITVASREFRFADSVPLKFGNLPDVEIIHNGTNTLISNETGDLYITNAQNDGDILFRCDDGSGGVTEYFRLDGGVSYTVASKAFRFLDTINVQLGDNADFTMQHNATNTELVNVTGNLNIKNSATDGDISFFGDDDSGGVTEYFRLDGGTARIESSKSFRFADSARVQLGASSDMQIYHDATDSKIENSTGNLEIINNTDDGDIIFKSDDGSGGTTEYFRLDGSEVSTKILTQKVIMSNLPTSDPSNAGQLYTDSGVLKVSAG